MGRQVPVNFATKKGTISGTAESLEDIGFSTAQVKAAENVLISVSGDAIRWLKDGAVPTAAEGHYLAANASPLTIKGNQDVRRFQFIRVTTDATYVVELEK